MSSSKTNNKVNLALCELENLDDVTNLKGLSMFELDCLRSAFAAGCSPQDVKKALATSGASKTTKVVDLEVKEKLFAEKSVKITVCGYFTNNTIREAYPIPPEEYSRIESLHLGGKSEDARSALQAAITLARKASNKTKSVLVENGPLKKKGVNETLLAELHSAIPAPSRAKNIFTEFISDKYIARVGGLSVSGEKEKLVKMVARILTHRKNSGQSYDDLCDLSGITIEGTSRR